MPDEELLALLAKAREEHTKGNLFENNGPDPTMQQTKIPKGMICTRMRGACEHGM